MKKIFQEKNLPLIIGFSLPLLMIAFIIASIYLPSLFTHPTFNFVYVINDNGYDTESFYVSNEQIKKILANPPQNRVNSIKPSLFVHNVATNKSKEISFEDAQRLIVDSSSTSPDGFKVVRGGNDGGFFLFGGYNGDYSARYIVGKGYSQKLDLNTSEQSYSDAVKFLGWIKK